ncbi:MAG: 3-oxoacyl-ACP synthase III [Pseudomonadota bacterium]
MRFENVSIIGVGYVEAPYRITSYELGEQILPTLEKFGLGPNLIEDMTGIRARRWWDLDLEFNAVAAMAAEKAMADAGIDKSQLGVLINTSVCRDFLEPSMACLVHGRLGLPPECQNFDVANACLAFINGMAIIGNMIERGQLDYGIVVDGEGSRYAVECTIKRLQDPNCDRQTFRENMATLTLGSGGAAMVLARSDLAPNGHKITACVNLAATQHNRLCLGQNHQMSTDASALLVAGLELAEKTWAKACQEMGWSPDYVDHCIIHQVSAVHTAKFCKTFGISQDKVFLTFPEYGNIGPAAVPFTLCKALEAGRIKKGDRVALMGIGSGINCSMMEVIW